MDFSHWLSRVRSSCLSLAFSFLFDKLKIFQRVRKTDCLLAYKVVVMYNDFMWNNEKFFKILSSIIRKLFPSIQLFSFCIDGHGLNAGIFVRFANFHFNKNKKQAKIKFFLHLVARFSKWKYRQSSRF